MIFLLFCLNIKGKFFYEELPKIPSNFIFQKNYKHQ
jgi:hypothetical protein